MGPGCAISNFSDENAIKYLKTHINWNLSCCEYFIIEDRLKLGLEMSTKQKGLDEISFLDFVQLILVLSKVKQ
jgi:hypothetical protein